MANPIATVLGLVALGRWIGRMTPNTGAPLMSDPAQAPLAPVPPQTFAQRARAWLHQTTTVEGLALLVAGIVAIALHRDALAGVLLPAAAPLLALPGGSRTQAEIKQIVADVAASLALHRPTPGLLNDVEQLATDVAAPASPITAAKP